MGGFGRSRNKMKHFILTAIIGFLASQSLWAEDTKDIDNTVAAGIIFKVAYLMGAQGTWSDLEHNSLKSFTQTMNTIAEDLSSFSDSKHGRDLKRRGETLISFLMRGITSTATAGDPDGVRFLKQLGLDPTGADPSELAPIFSERIAAYAKISGTPEWVYDPTKREQGGAHQSTTRSESRPK
jgi:hypothetical protein